MNVPVVGEGDEALERREPGCVDSVTLVCKSGIYCNASLMTVVAL